MLAWPGFALDLARGELFDADGRPTELRAQALKVLLVLGEQAGQVVSKDELLNRVWAGVVVTEDSLVQAVGDIRRVLGDSAHQRLRTVPRRGYLVGRRSVGIGCCARVGRQRAAGACRPDTKLAVATSVRRARRAVAGDHRRCLVHLADGRGAASIAGDPAV